MDNRGGGFALASSQFNMMGEIKKLSGHSAVYGIAGISSAAVSTILIPLYGHVFSPAEFGQLQLAQVWLSITITVACLGLSTAYFKVHQEYTSDQERRQTMGVVVSLSALSGGIACVVFMGLSIQSFTDHFALLNDPAFLIVLQACLITGVLIPIPFQLLRAQERSLRYFELGCVGLVLNLFLNFLIVWGLAGGVRGVFVAQALSAIAVLALSLPLLASNMHLTFSPKRAKELLRFGMPLVPAAAALWVLQGSDKIILERFWGVFEVGIYSLGYKYASILLFPLIAFQTAWAPYLFSVAKQEGAAQLISRILTFFLTIIMIFATLLYILRGVVLPLVASETFSGAEAIVAPVLLGLCFYGIYFITISGVYIHGKTGLVSVVVGLAAILNVGLNFLVIPSFGGSGAAWSTAISYLTLASIMYLFSRRYLPIYLEWHPLSLSVICCLAVSMASDHFVEEGWMAWVTRLFAVALIPVVLFLTGFVTREERQYIKSHFSSWRGVSSQL